MIRFEFSKCLVFLLFCGCSLTFCWIEPYIPKPLPPCSDYEMMIVNTKKCVSRCPIACVNGVCFENGTCPCDGFYQKNSTFGSLICVAQCLPGCPEAGGYCAAPNSCICRHGLTFDAVAQRCVLPTTLLDPCLGRCKYGTCSTTGNCTCAQGFVNNGTLLGQICQPVCTQNCGLLGYCYLPNMCTCRGKHWHYDKDGVCHADIVVFGK